MGIYSLRPKLTVNRGGGIIYLLHWGLQEGTAGDHKQYTVGGGNESLCSNPRGLTLAGS